jgi:hypothetical protein
MYIITGIDRQGKRFRIETETPQHYNIYKGSLWLKCTVTERKKLIKRYY